MQPTVAVTSQTLPDEGAVETVRVGCRGSRLVSASRFGLVLAKQDSASVDLLEGDVGLRHVIVVDGELIERVDGRVRIGPSLVQRWLRHDALPIFLRTVRQVLPVIRPDLEVGRRASI